MLNITIRKMQIKTTTRYRLTPVRMASIRKSINNKCQKRKPSWSVGGNANWYSYYGEQYAAAAAAKSLQSCPTLCDPIVHQAVHQAPCPWDSPDKNTGVGCYFLLQCMKVKSQSEVAQSCLTLSDPMDWSLPGSSVHGIFQARVLEWGAIAFSGRTV